MDDVIDDLLRMARRCESGASLFDEPNLVKLATNAIQATHDIGDAWSGSWIGYHASVYTANLQPKPPGEIFDADNHATLHFWSHFDYDSIVKEVCRRAGTTKDKLNEIGAVAGQIEQIFNDCKAEFLPTLEALLSDNEDVAIRGILEKAAKTPRRIPASDYIVAVRPQSMPVNDMRALQGGVQVPHHIAVDGWIHSHTSTQACLEQMGEYVKYVTRYLQKRLKMKGNTVGKTDGPIFIGHGHSPVWKDLKDFIRDRLKLPWEEFNRESVAGKSTKERLLELLDKCPFAFLVMTAEDITTDGKAHARESVIHEIGLFQGRYGWARAIILLEEGCEEFSNIVGTGQIRFSKGNLKAEFEEIRRVLERERLL